MSALAASLALAAPLLLAASDEKGLFHFPGDGDFRFQSVAKADNEAGWPFAATEGYLVCVYVLGQPQSYFMEKGEAVEGVNRALALSNDPFQLAFVNLGQASRFAPNDGLEDLLRRLAPFVQTARRLCDQPRGTQIGPGEL